MEQQWTESQKFEKSWWLTYESRHAYEIIKGDFIGRIMMLDKGFPERTVIDIGSGPFSLLQRIPVKRGTAVDPIYYDGLEEGYKAKNIERIIMRGEDLDTLDDRFNEAWIYNCLQHVINPTRILKNAMILAPIVRIFEWINIPPYEGHLHMLTPALLEAPFIEQGWTILQKSTGFLNHDDLGGEYFSAIYQKTQLGPPHTSLDVFVT